jgi:hypothetical protein
MCGVECPLTFNATACCTPARIILRTADRRKSWNRSPSHPAFFVALSYSFRRFLALKAYHHDSFVSGSSIATGSLLSGKTLACLDFV